MKIVNAHPDIYKFISALDDETVNQTTRVIELLQLHEYRLRMPYSKKIEKDIYELRIKSIKNIRIFYAFYNDKIFLLHAVNKEKQKLLSKDIDTARRRFTHLRS